MGVELAVVETSAVLVSEKLCFSELPKVESVPERRDGGRESLFSDDVVEVEVDGFLLRNTALLSFDASPLERWLSVLSSLVEAFRGAMSGTDFCGRCLLSFSMTRSGFLRARVRVGVAWLLGLLSRSCVTTVTH
jgi:hypothetical protein